MANKLVKSLQIFAENNDTININKTLNNLNMLNLSKDEINNIINITKNIKNNDTIRFIRKIYKKLNRKFYVCSYGGCGSRMLWRFLEQYGETHHIHARNPPQYLEYLGGTVNRKWFNGNKINDPSNYTVIYIYKNPIKSIHSRFWNIQHRKNVQVNKKYLNTSINEMAESGKDLYDIESFYDNYNKNKKNYDIYAIKYDLLFDNIDLIRKELNLPNIYQFPKKKESNRKYDTILYNKLQKIYQPLLDKMNDMPVIKRIPYII